MKAKSERFSSHSSKHGRVKVYVCPKCKSVNVFHPFRFRNLFGMIPRWECRDCGFQSSIFPIGIVDVDKLKGEGKKK